MKVLVAVVVGTALSVLSADPAAAAWPKSTVQRTSGAVRMATVNSAFEVVSGGVGGTTFEVEKPVSLVSTSTVDLVNTSTVPVTMAGAVDLQSFVSTTVTVSSCGVPWVTLLCPAGNAQTAYLSLILPAKQNIVWKSTAMAPQSRIYLKVLVAGAVANKLTLTATPTPARAPGNRTWS